MLRAIPPRQGLRYGIDFGAFEKALPREFQPISASKPHMNGKKSKGIYPTQTLKENRPKHHSTPMALINA